MIKKQKIKIIDNLINILSNNKTIYFIDFSNMNANQIAIFRRDCFNKNIDLKVFKNTLIKIAIKKIENKNFEIFYNLLNGNTCIITSIINKTPAEVINNFRKKINYKRPLLKGAYVEEQFYIGDMHINSLINIKSKEDIVREIIISLINTFDNLIHNINLSSQVLLYNIIKCLKKQEK